MTDSYETQSRSLFQAVTAVLFLDALLLKKAKQTPMLTGKHSKSIHS